MQHPRQAANVLSKGPRDGAFELITEYLEPGMMLDPVEQADDTSRVELHGSSSARSKVHALRRIFHQYM
jgi:hypothetical protein